jgi:beta-glucosidase
MRRWFFAATAATIFAAASTAAAVNPADGPWPHIAPKYKTDPALEKRIAAMVRGMSLREKVAQMTEGEIKKVTPADVKTYGLGSVLNGGGSWPHMDRSAAPKVWVDLADQYYDAAMSAPRAVKIPPIWGVDAVHGHNNVRSATLFPHNIGLGAARDPELIREIGRATAKAVRATGIAWAFAPTLAVVQDQRWGRTYESYSSDPALVRAYGYALVHGLQGDLHGPDSVIGSAKHFIGDGGTRDGKNEGVNEADLDTLIKVHGAGYFGALEAGVQTVMVSYSSWNDVADHQDFGKMHADKALVTDVLKGKLGFDGFVISDWDGVAQVPGCAKSHCPQAINAGVDMVMVPDEWKAFIDNTVHDVVTGAIPMSRIDDAVTRILRVKLRAGTFAHRPSDNPYAGKTSALQAKTLARRAVRESLVLLKNNHRLLPLTAGKRILVVGKSADSLPNQVGGWSVTWQGDEISNADFPGAASVLAALRQNARAAKLDYSADGAGVDPKGYDVIIAVVGERPYAETAGDIVNLAHSARYPEDLAVLQKVSNRGTPVITVFESGRTAYVNDLLNLSDAFVAAWLPGTEGAGVTDLLFPSKPRGAKNDFRGRLSFDWPASACPTGAAPLFKRGYGLDYQHQHGDMETLPVSMPKEGCSHDRPAA